MKKLLIILLTILVANSCEQDHLPPSAKCSIFPSIGDTTIYFELDAGKSLNGKGLNVDLRYRWDFTDDGQWDTEWRSESAIGHRFIIPGTHKTLVEVTDFNGLVDTASVVVKSFGRNKDLSQLVDPRDGQNYRIVKVNEVWWMSENLKYGRVLQESKRQTNNDTTEQYKCFCPYNSDTTFGLYSWQEAMDYRLGENHGICPPGWQIPSTEDWNDLIGTLPKFYAIRYFGLDGFSGMSLQSGQHMISSNITNPEPVCVYNGFWASDFKRESEVGIIPGVFYFDQAVERSQLGASFQHQSGPENDLSLVQYFSVRCIKKE